FSEKKINHLIKKYLDQPLEKSKPNNRTAFDNYQPFNKVIERDTYQAHCMIGNIAYSSIDDKKTGLVLLNNILGGPAMNSRLNMGIREKYGYTYNIESTYNTYSDSGLFSIYLGTDYKHLDKSINLVHKELKKLKRD